MTKGLDELKDSGGVDSQSSSSSAGSSSSTGTSSDDDSEFPRYIEETPFIAITIEGDSLACYNRPEHVDIVYRQYQKDSDLKLYEVPEYIEHYWLTSWSFKSAAQRYKKKTGSDLYEDLHGDPEATLKTLDCIPSGDGVRRQTHSCAVCDDEIEFDDDYVSIQNKRVCPDHSTAELVDAGVLNIHTSKSVSDSQGDEVREVPDTSNRRWE